jgi:hypothetical protein
MLHALLCLLPIAAIALPLLARRYPGERLLLAAQRSERRRLPQPRRVAVSRARTLVVAAHGRELIGRSLAVRPPPPALALS